MEGVAIPHYHVITGFRGCLPESNEVFFSRQEALEAAKYFMDGRDMVLTFPPHLESIDELLLDNGDVFWEDRGKYSTYYVQVTACDDPQCLEELLSEW